MPSLARLEARWSAVVDRYVGSLLGKVHLSRVRPIALQDGVLTVGGRLDALELKQIEACRQGVERLLMEDFGVPLRVRFLADDSVAPNPPIGVQGGPDLASSAPAPATSAGGAGPQVAPEVWETGEPDWPDPEPELVDGGLDDDAGIPLVEAAARLFGAEVVPD
jgi:hypothetical protein